MACNEGKAGPATCRSLGGDFDSFYKFFCSLGNLTFNWSLPSERVSQRTNTLILI